MSGPIGKFLLYLGTDLRTGFYWLYYAALAVHAAESVVAVLGRNSIQKIVTKITPKDHNELPVKKLFLQKIQESEELCRVTILVIPYVLLKTKQRLHFSIRSIY